MIIWKTIKSATIESSIESSFFDISSTTYKQEKSVDYPNGIFPLNLISCIKSTDGDKGILKNVNWFDSVLLNRRIRVILGHELTY